MQHGVGPAKQSKFRLRRRERTEVILFWDFLFVKDNVSKTFSLVLETSRSLEQSWNEPTSIGYCFSSCVDLQSKVSFFWTSALLASVYCSHIAVITFPYIIFLDIKALLLKTIYPPQLIWTEGHSHNFPPEQLSPSSYPQIYTHPAPELKSFWRTNTLTPELLSTHTI